MKRYLSYEEATAQLPRVREAVVELQALYAELRSLQAALGQVASAGQAAELERRAEELVGRMREALRRIEAAGGELKDLDLGLVDFPTLRGGQPVYYCWRLGEPEIRYWHGLEEGFAGRKPIRPEDWTTAPVA